MLEIKFKKLVENAVAPTRAHDTDAGWDLTAIDVQVGVIKDNTPIVVYKTGIAIEIPEGHVGLLFPRSSVADKSLILSNSVGVIDSGYRGEVIAKFRVSSGNAIPNLYQPGERFAQLIVLPYPQISMVESTELSDSDRGENGFGSTSVDVNEPVQNEIVKDGCLPIAATETFEDTVNHSENVMVKFSADWCGACKQIEPVIKEVYSEYSNKLPMYSVNTDRDPALRDKYHVTNVPAIIFFKNGTEVSRLVGYRSKETITEALDYLLSDFNEIENENIEQN